MGTLVASVLGASDADVASAGEPEEGSTWSLADAIPPGTSAAVALIEHLWATPLREAVARAGGTALEETWLHATTSSASTRSSGGTTDGQQRWHGRRRRRDLRARHLRAWVYYWQQADGLWSTPTRSSRDSSGPRTWCLRHWLR